LRGQKFDLVVLDEVAMMRGFAGTWQEVIRPTLTDTKGEALFISTPKGFKHFYDLFTQSSRDPDYKSFQFKTTDNPHIPSDEVEKARKELTEDRFAQEYLADFRKTEGLVYKEFNRSRHVFQKGEGRDFVKVFGGVDFGFTNPCAAITIKKDRFAVYWITDEWYKTQQTDAQIADYVYALKWDECYPDPESPAAIEELRKRGVNTREVVRELFKTNRLRIHESCRNLIWELETYSYPDSKPDRNDDENPIKEGDHAMDAMRYALSMDNALTVEQFHPPTFFQTEEKANPAE
jgi:phage terminase large subunit